jgi:FlaA1/EpsC-like NDP-sugar epimerase
MIALVAAGVARYDFQPSAVSWRGLLALCVLVAMCQVLVGVALGLYAGRWKYGSFDEIAALGCAVLLTATFGYVVDVVVRGPQMVPRSVPIVGALAAFVAMGAVRFAWRGRLEHVGRRPRRDAVRLVVFGAGAGGVEAIRSILNDQSCTYEAVALLDDNPRKHNLRLMSVPVAGDRSRMADVAAKYGANTLLIATPSASGETLAELSRLATSCGLAVKVLPPVRALFGDGVRLEDIRDIRSSDLLGRDPIETDVPAIAGYLTGRRILVTGAGGSIGAELCRQITRFSPAELMMLDRDESGLHAVQISIEGHGLLDTPDLILADVRDRSRIDEILRTRQPNVVFHAAALKHLPLLEQSPSEALKSNVWGTLNLLEASAAAGVDRFVNISTDKAADPISALGYSKRIAERAHRRHGDQGGRHVRERPVWQRPRQPGLGAHVVPGTGRVGGSDHGHRSGGDPVLHDGGGIRRARHPGGGDRTDGRSPRARHGHASADPRGRSAPGSQRAPARRDRLHRSSSRREAARGPVRLRRRR